MNVLPWSLPLKIIACTFHSVAIASTIFRLVYRWYMARFWWEDGFAMFALAVDVPCLVCAWLEVPYASIQDIPPIDNITHWMVSMGFPSVLWACRLSILFSIIRVASPSQQLRRIALLIGCSFLVMWAALMAQKIQICATENCVIAGSVGLSQLITDVISDSLLVILPIYLLQSLKISRRQRITIFSAFSATLLITVVTILHSAALFTVQSTGILVIGHVKVALSLIVCNLLVIVAFVYSLCCRRDLDAAEEELSLTTVDLNTCLTDSAMDKHTTILQHSVATATERSCLTAARMIEVAEKAEGVVEPKLA
ncbi:hypothetical protein EV363DRAFT_1399330 [Boletus edulis]|uniref:Rhodopsin domain-containing protein n=1 Tax=Boletus edulis BED1 TaxID=1328754 RepID=A0AAD4BSP0_BOLED|nr:hypothetical protein EV363DRAFT_1399330 [Boletus edulis]KAF8438408.1 hypothetical protein L210DRAFT_959398 [Boletus edulis BED1]